MPIDEILALLIAERDRLSRAIEALQGTVKRRGRPPKNPVAIFAAVPTKKRAGSMGAAARKAQSARMKAYWAKRRKEQAKKN